MRRVAGLRAALACAAIGAPACVAVGPDHVPPTMAAPADLAVALEHGVTDGPADLRTWWTAFEDPVLDTLVAEAVLENLDLREALLRVHEAAARAGIATGERYPRVDLEGSYERNRISENNAVPLFVGVPLRQEASTIGLSASWEVDLWGRVRRAVEAAGAEVDASAEDLRAVRVSIVAEVAARYAEVRALQQRGAIARENLRIQQGTLDLAASRHRAGLVNDLDVMQARANLERTRATLPALAAAERAASNQIALLLGRAPGEVDALIGASGAIPQRPPAIALGLPADLLRRRPDVRRAERELAAQSARVGVATADLYPRLTLLGSLGRASAEVGDLFDGGSEVYAFGPSVSWPIFAGGSIRARIDAEDARHGQALVAWERAVLVALREASDALSAFLREQERSAALESALAAARGAVAQSGALYREGLVDFENVLDNERTLFAIEDDLVRSRGEVARHLIELYRALGGGLDEASAAHVP